MTHRTDIDGLRGLAVLAVFAGHLGLSGVPGGFVGVDVFFVVSGFVIARQVTPETCKIIFQCEVDLGGNLPDAVVDFQMKKFAADALRAFSNEFQQPFGQETGE